MKKPKCPSCGKPIARTLGVHIDGDTTYYLNRSTCGYIYWPGHWSPAWHWKKRKDILQAFQSFYCRYCREVFPEKLEKEIFKYLKQDAILRKLTK